MLNLTPNSSTLQDVYLPVTASRKFWTNEDLYPYELFYVSRSTGWSAGFYPEAVAQYERYDHFKLRTDGSGDYSIRLDEPGLYSLKVYISKRVDQTEPDDPGVLGPIFETSIYVNDTAFAEFDDTRTPTSVIYYE